MNTTAAPHTSDLPKASPPPATVWPCLTYRDAHAAMAFLEAAFGFTRTLVVDGEDGRAIRHAELRWPLGGGVMLGSAVEDGDEFARLPTGNVSLYVVTNEPDALFARATAAGAAVVRELVDTDYGSRDFAVRDPEGNIWSFGTYRGT